LKAVADGLHSARANHGTRKNHTMTLSLLADATEAQTARKVVKLALARGWAVSLYDGEEWTLKRSTARNAIWSAMASTDADTLRFRDADGVSLGTMSLVYGNGGEDLIADHSDNDAMCALAKDVTKA
jgi:hypothetical protein